jgi:hypothetical protein
MHSAGVPTQNDVPCSRTSAASAPGCGPLAGADALVVALIVRRHRGRIIIAPHQARTFALLLEIPADKFGAALGYDCRVFMAIARGHQRGAPCRPSQISRGRL